MTDIIIADDHTIFREGLKQILRETSDIAVAGEAANGAELLERVRKGNYDVVVLDIAMPGRGGLEVLKELRSERPRLPILILSMYPEEQYAVRALKAGASGYLTKTSASDELISAIRKVATGGKYVSASLAEKLALHLDNENERPLHERLSDREYQVMRMIASGESLQGIAKKLSLSAKTISTNRARILQKMKMKTNAEITYYAVKHELVD